MRIKIWTSVDRLRADIKSKKKVLPTFLIIQTLNFCFFNNNIPFLEGCGTSTLAQAHSMQSFK